MSSSRARTRVAALAAVIPVFVAAGPLVTPALAADPFVVSNLIDDGQVVGPNAGYLGLGIGQTGSTAMFKVAAPDKTSTINSVELTLTQIDNAHTYQFQNELDGTDGLAVYADVNETGVFDAADKAAGPVSSGFSLARTPTATEIPFKVSFATPASGATVYFVAMHPKSNPLTSGRRFAFRLDPGAVVTSNGNVPVSAVTTPLQGATTDPRMRVDSAAPAQPARTAFTVTANVPGTEDEYTIDTTAAGGDTTAKAIFFNAEGTTAPSAILRRLSFNPATAPEAQVGNLAVHTIVNGAATNAVKIGDGSGVFPDEAILAKNNQINNAVYARFVDAVGNISAPAILSDCVMTNGACETARGNPVVAPKAPTSAELLNTTAINLTNHRAVPVTVAPESNSLLARGDRAGTGTTNADKYSRAVNVTAYIATLTSGGTLDLTRTTDQKTKAAASPVTFTGTDAFDTIVSETPPRGIEEGLKVASVVAVAVDRAGNVSAPKTSASGYTKDIVAPTASFSVADNSLSEGELVTIQFSEPMNTGNITASTTNALGGCNDSTEPNSAEAVLDVKAPSGTPDKTWGHGYCFAWIGDGSTASIELGNPALRVPASTLPAVGDRVNYGTLTDKHGNAIITPGGTAPFFGTIQLPVATPVEAHTRDVNFDGKLDAVDVSFTTTVAATKMNAVLANLSIVSPTTTVPVTSVVPATNINGRSTLRFNFTSEFGTAVLPAVRLAIPANATNTGVQDENNNWVAPFSKVPVDKALPQPIRALTADEQNGGAAGRDGRIDKIYLTYSEAIVPNQDNNPAPTNVNSKAYDVTGYTPAPAQPRSVGVNQVSPGNESSTPNDVKVISLPQATASDTGVRPTVNFTAFTDPTNKRYAPTDVAGNQWAPTTTPTAGLPHFSIVPGDGAAPFIVSRTTRDLDNDGYLDAIDIVFSEEMPTLAAAGQFTVADRTITAQDVIGTTGVRILLQEITTTGGDTAVRPNVQYVGGVTDLSGNALAPETAPVAPADGAGPAIMGACAAWKAGINGSCPIDEDATTDDGMKANVFLSEPVTTASVQGADFVVEQNAAAKPVTAVTPIAAANNAASSFTLAFALNSIAALDDFSVKFSAANVVDDAATPTVKNSQIAAVTALGAPVATMELECSVETNDPEFCSSTTLSTGIENSASVIGWRLKKTARGTLVDPADYVSTRPATVTAPFIVEGLNELFLSGIDKFGRLSTPEATDRMTVLLPPVIPAGSVQMANSNSGLTKSNQWSRASTVRDGDVLKIKADAFGADAAEWASSNGGCLADHMSINLRAVTGNPADTERAPFDCAMKIGTAQPGRQMLFPATTVLRTTRYPVGTVIKYTSTDPGALIVDGPNGTVARRHFISNAARRSWLISDASVVTVPKALVSALPRQANIGYRDGAILKASTGALYYVERGVKRPVSAARLKYWRISTTTAYPVTATELKSMPTGSLIGSTRHADGTWIKYNDGRIYQIVKNAQGVSVRRKLASYSALRTRVPSTHVYAANLADNNVPIDNNWLIGYRDGVMLRFGTSTNPTFGVISRGSLRMFANPQTFNSLGFNAANAITPNTLAIPRVSGETYRTGTAIDRYKIESVVIKVTNKVGAIATATVMPAWGGIWGIGTIDPRPAGWDATR